MNKKTVISALTAIMFTLTACGSNISSKNISESDAYKPTSEKTDESILEPSSEDNEIVSYEKEDNIESYDDSSKEVPVDNSSDSQIDESAAEDDPEAKILVAYFTNIQTDNSDANASASRLYRNDELVGVTEYGAQIISEYTGGDLFFIKGSDYPADYDSTTQVAHEEQQSDARPELENHIDNIDDYDVIFVCYPTWWTDMPMAVYSFFDEYDLSGKIIVPFNTHWGYGAADTYETIAELEPNADVREGLSVYNYDMESSESAITDWVDGLEIINR